MLDLSDYDPQSDLSAASTLPARWYRDPLFAEAEKKFIFARAWQLAGRKESVREPGDYFTTEIAGEPLVLVRDANGTLRAFSNVCRHRAGPVAMGSGNRKSLQCKYHGWTYALDGTLLTQPEFEGVRNWEKSGICLPEFQVDTWGPFVFANLSGGTSSLSDYLQNIPREVRENGFDVESMRFLERREYVVRCNWKVYVDNYLEGYHIPMVHPGLFRELDYDRYRVETFRYYSSADAPIRESKAAAGTQNRVYAGAGKQALYYWVFPNWMINIYPGNLQVNIVVPQGHEKTLTIFDWYARDAEMDSQLLKESIAFSDQIQREDVAICEAVQRGLQSSHYNQGRYSVKRENGVHHFHLLLHEFLSK